MKKNLTIIILAFLALIGIIIFLVMQERKTEQMPFVKRNFPSTISVTNETGYFKADTIVLNLADLIFSFDTLDIKIYYIPEVLQSGKMEFYGLTERIPFKSHSYLIMLSKGLSFSKLKLTLSHEFVHIDQYERGELSFIKDGYIWQGDTAFFSDVEYRNRPFEIEAFSKQNRIEKELEEVLYNE